MQTLEEQLAVENEYDLDYSRVVRVLLRDGWHTVHKTTETDRSGLAVTIKNLRKKLDHPNPATPKTDEQMIAEYPQFIPYKQHPGLQPHPFRKVTIEGATWAAWDESREPVPILAQLLVPWNQILALDMERPR